MRYKSISISSRLNLRGIRINGNLTTFQKVKQNRKHMLDKVRCTRSYIARLWRRGAVLSTIMATMQNTLIACLSIVIAIQSVVKGKRVRVV